MPGKKFKITAKHRRFCRLVIEIGNVQEAARQIGFSGKYADNLVNRNVEIQRLIDELQYKAGLTDELLLRAHVELLTQKDDRTVRLGAVRLGYQVKKKIGSDDPLPPKEIPEIHIHLDTNGKPDTGKRSTLPADPAANVSIHLANK